jgi:hypothetical protein
MKIGFIISLISLVVSIFYFVYFITKLDEVFLFFPIPIVVSLWLVLNYILIEGIKKPNFKSKK